MKVLITNTVALNTGDAAILESEILLLRQLFGSDTQVEIYGFQTDIAARYYPELVFKPALHSSLIRNPSFAFLQRVYGRLERTHERPDVLRFYTAADLYGRGQRRLARSLLSNEQFDWLAEYASADLIVSTGGTYLVEHYKLDAKIFDLMIAVLLRRPLVLYSQSLGPFANPKNRDRLRTVFQRAAAVLLRDERSERHIRQLGVNGGNLHVTADVAFALADPDKWREPVRAGHRLRVAVSVREWANFKNRPAGEGQAYYVAAMRDLIVHLVRRHNAEVVLLSTCQGIPEYWTDDSRLAAHLHDALPADIAQHVTVDGSFHSPDTLIELLRGFDLVISTRMHLAILALSAGTPALAVAYEFKSIELFRELDHGNLVHDIEDITGEAIIRSIDELVANLAGVRDSLRRATLRQRKRVHESAERVKQAYQSYRVLS